MDPANKDEKGQLIDFEVNDANAQSTPPNTANGSTTNSHNVIPDAASSDLRASQIDLGLSDYNDYVNKLYEQQVIQIKLQLMFKQIHIN